MTFLYPTASTIAVFLQGYHVEQAYQLQFKELNNKVPIYGYNDYRFSKVALGKQLIQGVLVVNFLFAGYLNTILEGVGTEPAYVPRLYNYGFSEKGEKEKERLARDIQNQIKTELPSNATSEDRAARAAYLAGLLTKDKNTKEATKAALEKTFLAQDVARFNDLVSPLRVNSTGATLDLYYQDPAYATWFVRFKNVFFNEVSQANSQAGAEGSSDPLYEIYSFIASERIIKLVGEIE